MTIKSKLQRLGAVLATSAILFTGTVAIAQPASAATTISCYNTSGTPYIGAQGRLSVGSMRYIQYNWYERTFQHYQSGWYWFPGQFC